MLNENQKSRSEFMVTVALLHAVWATQKSFLIHFQPDLDVAEISKENTDVLLEKHTHTGGREGGDTHKENTKPHSYTTHSRPYKNVVGVQR